MKLTKVQKKNLLKIDDPKPYKIHMSSIKSLYAANLIEIDLEDGQYVCLTDKGVAATKIAKREKLWKRFGSWSRREIIEKCELAFRHSLPTDLYEDEEIVDMLVNKYVPIDHEELMMFV